jgi:hypothetical protein
MPFHEFVQALCTAPLRLLHESGFGLPAEATFLFSIHKDTSSFEMPLIESDFSFRAGVGFNLLYCYDVPQNSPLDFCHSKYYTARRSKTLVR